MAHSDRRFSSLATWLLGGIVLVVGSAGLLVAVAPLVSCPYSMLMPDDLVQAAIRARAIEWGRSHHSYTGDLWARGPEIVAPPAGGHGYRVELTYGSLSSGVTGALYFEPCPYCHGKGRISLLSCWLKGQRPHSP